MFRILTCICGYVFGKFKYAPKFIYTSFVTSISIAFFIPIVLIHLTKNILIGKKPQHGFVCSCCSQHDCFNVNQPLYQSQTNGKLPSSSKYLAQDDHVARNNVVKVENNLSSSGQFNFPTVQVASYSPNEARNMRPLNSTHTSPPSKPIVPSMSEIQHVKLAHRPSIVMQTHEQKRRLSAIAMDPSSTRRPSTAVPSRAPPPPPPPGAPHRAPITKMKSFYWNKIQSQAISPVSAWMTKISAQNLPIKVDEIQHLFKSIVQEPKLHTEDKKTIVSILDAKKAHNMSILLSQIREVTDDEIRDNVMSGTHGNLTKEHLELLSKFEPTEEESNAILHYSGDANALGRAERYFFEVLRGHRFVQKLEVLVIKSRFNSRVAQLRSNLAIIEQATIELTSSDRFLVFLGAVLGVGNHLNSGGRLGNAQAFHLDSLSKISDTRIHGGKQTLLHYIISFLKNHAADALNWPDDMPSIIDIAKVPFETLVGELHKLKKDLKKIDHELHGDDIESQNFRDVMQEFEDHALEEVNDLDMHFSSLQENLTGMFEFYADDLKKANDMHAVREWFELLSNFLHLYVNARNQLESSNYLLDNETAHHET